MRERLAKARDVTPDMDVCAASAFGSRCGNLLLRGIDNGHRTSLLEAKGILVEAAIKREKRSVSVLDINKAAHYVIRYLNDHRCETCGGTKTNTNEHGVKYPCKPCLGTGFVEGKPRFWGELHEGIFRDALTEMGWALKSSWDHYYESMG